MGVSNLSTFPVPIPLLFPLIFRFFLKFSNFEVRYVLVNSRVKSSQACYQCHFCGNFYSLTFDSAINANFAEIFIIYFLYTVILGCNKLSYNEHSVTTNIKINWLVQVIFMMVLPGYNEQNPVNNAQKKPKKTKNWHF